VLSSQKGLHYKHKVKIVLLTEIHDEVIIVGRGAFGACAYGTHGLYRV
jgi:hypothetical protein